jgi:hypothetical protein
MTDQTLATMTDIGTIVGTEKIYVDNGTATNLYGTPTEIKTYVSASPTLVTPALGTPASGTLTSCTADGTNLLGYRGVPQNGQNATYTCVLGDAGKHILMQTAGAFAIPTNASVAYPVGTVLTFVNGTTSSTITLATDTMTLAGSATVGTRTLAANGIATAIKVTSTSWIISGTGLT